jgi:ribosomal protein S27AE
VDTHLRINLGRDLFENYGAYVEAEGPFPFEQIGKYVLKLLDSPEWAAIIEAAEFLRPSISKHHEASVTLSDSLRIIKDQAQLAGLDFASVVRGLVSYFLDHPDTLRSLSQMADEQRAEAVLKKSRTNYRFDLDSVFEYEFEEIPLDGIDLEPDESNYVTRCCEAIAYRDDEDNLFCPECGGLVFYSQPTRLVCPQCGLADIDEEGRCVVCFSRVGHSIWDRFR